MLPPVNQLEGVLLKMPSIPRPLRSGSLAIAGLACLVLLCLLSFGNSITVIGSPDTPLKDSQHQLPKRNENTGDNTSSTASPDAENNLGIIPGKLSIPSIPGLPIPVSTVPSVLTYPTVVPTQATQPAGGGLGGLLSVVGSILSATPQPTAVAPLPLPVPTSAAGGIVPVPTTLPLPLSVPTSAAGGIVPVPTTLPLPLSVPTSAAGGILPIPTTPPLSLPVPTSATGGILPVPTILPVPSPTDVLPLPITSPPGIPTNPASSAPGGGLLGGLLGLGNIVSAIDGVIGQSNDGLIDQLTSGVLAPLDAILSDPVAILADPTSALANLQSQVVTVLDTLPSAVAVGAQVVDNLGSQLASAVSDVPALLTAVPAIGDGIGDQVGSLVNIVPSIAAALPEAAISIVDQIGSIVSAVPGVGPDLGGALEDLTNQLSSQVVYILPEATSLVGDLVDHITSLMPPEIGSIVGGLASVVQSEVSGILCQVSSVVEGTAVIFNVPCSELATSSPLPLSSEISISTGPATVFASATEVLVSTLGTPSDTGSLIVSTPGESLLPIPTSIPVVLSSILSQLSSSLASLTSASVNNIVPTGNSVNSSPSTIPLPLQSSLASALSSLFTQSPSTTAGSASDLPPPLSSLLSQLSALSQTAAMGGTSPGSPLATAGSILSSLASQISSMMTQTAAPAAPTGPVDSNPPPLSSILSAISSLSAAANTPTAPNTALPTPPISSLPLSPTGTATTVYYVRTITELITSTAVQTLTQCTSTALIPIPESPCPSGTGAVSPTTADPMAGPCPGQGYSCDSCIDGWFCPPQQTPALPAPCGLGWPCYHCSSGWFCVPTRASETVPSTINICSVSQASVPLGLPTAPLPGTLPSVTPPAQIPTFAPLVPKELSYPAIGGYQYAGCFVDSPTRALTGIQMPSPVSDNMTNSLCINYCEGNSFTLAGTENGTQCFCGNALVDSYLLDDQACNMTCTGGPSDNCGGAWALSLYSPNRDVPRAQGPSGQFTLANTPGGQHPGGVRQTILPIVSQIYAWPAPPPPAPAPAGGPSAMPSPDIAGLQSTMSSIVSEALSEASQVMDSELAKASSVLGDAESIVSQGMSSIASNLNSIASGAGTAITGSSAAISVPSLTNVPFGPGPVVPSIPLLASILTSTLPVQASSTSPIKTSSTGILPTVSATPGQDNISTSAGVRTTETDSTANESSTRVITVREARVSSGAVGFRDSWHRRRAHWA